LFTDGEFSAFLMAFIYALCGLPGAWQLWYKRVYNSCKRDRAFGFLVFFAMFCVHILFVVFMAVAPPGFGAEKWSMCGVLNLQEALEKNKIIGIMHAIVMSIFMIDAALSLLCIRRVYVSFRGGGHTLEQARTEAYQEGARSAAMGGFGSSSAV
jgi:hypothetical protein